MIYERKTGGYVTMINGRGWYFSSMGGHPTPPKGHMWDWEEDEWEDVESVALPIQMVQGGDCGE